jgi:hypothetical protein
MEKQVPFERLNYELPLKGVLFAFDSLPTGLAQAKRNVGSI